MRNLDGHFLLDSPRNRLMALLFSINLTGCEARTQLHPILSPQQAQLDRYTREMEAKIDLEMKKKLQTYATLVESNVNPIEALELTQKYGLRYDELYFLNLTPEDLEDSTIPKEEWPKPEQRLKPKQKEELARLSLVFESDNPEDHVVESIDLYVEQSCEEYSKELKIIEEWLRNNILCERELLLNPKSLTLEMASKIFQSRPSVFSKVYYDVETPEQFKILLDRILLK